MRTIKALVCAATLAAGLASVMAQSNVYSLNVVGYYNIPCAAGSYTLIANQLNTTNNSLGSLIPTPPADTLFYKFTGAWNAYQYSGDDSTWYPDSLVTLNLGEAGLYKPTAATTLTFVGEVRQGALTISPITPGIPTVVASMVPQAGAVSADLQFPVEANDLVYKFTGAWNGFQYSGDDSTYYPSEPTFGVGEGMMIKKANGGTVTAWTRNFTVQ